MEEAGSSGTYKQVRAEVLGWLGPKIRKRMKELGISEPALEKMTGIGASTISDYLMGRYEPSLSKIVLLGEALGVDWNFFFEKEAEPSVVHCAGSQDARMTSDE